MSDIKLFNLKGEAPVELAGKSVALEKSLQNLIEAHLDIFLGVRFLATEYSTGKVHAGRIDTLGIDENGCPVIIELKRTTDENVINQGLFYLDWLMDHRGEFELLVLKKLGQEASSGIEWSSPRLICIAGDFTKYDSHAVQQIPRNIELVRYRKYGDDLLLLELVNAAAAPTATKAPATAASPKGTDATSFETRLADAPSAVRDLFEGLRTLVSAFGDDVRLKRMPSYFAFVRLKNFVWVKLGPKGSASLLLNVALEPSDVSPEEGFTRDVSDVPSMGRAKIEVLVRSIDDLERAKPLLLKSYEAS